MERVSSRTLGRRLLFGALDATDPDSYLAGLCEALLVVGRLLEERLGFAPSGSDEAIRELETLLPMRAIERFRRLLEHVPAITEDRTSAGQVDRILDLQGLEVETEEPLGRRANWIAAIAVALANERSAGQDAADAIARAAGDDRGAILAAMSRLELLRALDGETRFHALELLRQVDRSTAGRDVRPTN